jgi:methylated-DNA-protein-cysteine methyltransferase-like protein
VKRTRIAAPPEPATAEVSDDADGRWQRIYAVVRRIPKGRVATYGQVAELAGLPGHARQVGYALHALPPHSTVPWQRVVNAKGEISPRGGQLGSVLPQRFRLEAEGVELDTRGRISLERFGWKPRARKRDTEDE